MSISALNRLFSALSCLPLLQDLSLPRLPLDSPQAAAAFARFLLSCRRLCSLRLPHATFSLPSALVFQQVLMEIAPPFHGHSQQKQPQQHQQPQQQQQHQQQQHASGTLQPVRFHLEQLDLAGALISAAPITPPASVPASPDARHLPSHWPSHLPPPLPTHLPSHASPAAAAAHQRSPTHPGAAAASAASPLLNSLHNAVSTRTGAGATAAPSPAAAAAAAAAAAVSAQSRSSHPSDAMAVMLHALLPASPRLRHISLSGAHLSTPALLPLLQYLASPLCRLLHVDVSRCTLHHPSALALLQAMAGPRHCPIGFLRLSFNPILSPPPNSPPTPPPSAPPSAHVSPSPLLPSSPPIPPISPHRMPPSAASAFPTAPLRSFTGPSPVLSPARYAVHAPPCSAVSPCRNALLRERPEDIRQPAKRQKQHQQQQQQQQPQQPQQQYQWQQQQERRTGAEAAGDVRHGQMAEVEMVEESEDKQRESEIEWWLNQCEEDVMKGMYGGMKLPVGDETTSGADAAAAAAAEAAAAESASHTAAAASVAPPLGAPVVREACEEAEGGIRAGAGIGVAGGGKKRGRVDGVEFLPKQDNEAARGKSAAQVPPAAAAAAVGEQSDHPNPFPPGSPSWRAEALLQLRIAAEAAGFGCCCLGSSVRAASGGMGSSNGGVGRGRAGDGGVLEVDGCGLSSDECALLLSCDSVRSGDGGSGDGCCRSSRFVCGGAVGGRVTGAAGAGVDGLYGLASALVPPHQCDFCSE
ncbi:hypothetical protein CLOP_g23129 [Closterium sp. NIES-67]|nr:hypothetical protein CLOP_g23129 [Closterium sp. NIES-67]